MKKDEKGINTSPSTTSPLRWDFGPPEARLEARRRDAKRQRQLEIPNGPIWSYKSVYRYIYIIYGNNMGINING